MPSDLRHLEDDAVQALYTAVDTLRAAALGGYRLPPEVRQAISELDNHDVFAAIDEEWYGRE